MSCWLFPWLKMWFMFSCTNFMGVFLTQSDHFGLTGVVDKYILFSTCFQSDQDAQTGIS